MNTHVHIISTQHKSQLHIDNITQVLSKTLQLNSSNLDPPPPPPPSHSYNKVYGRKSKDINPSYPFLFPFFYTLASLFDFYYVTIEAEAQD